MRELQVCKCKTLSLWLKIKYFMLSPFNKNDSLELKKTTEWNITPDHIVFVPER